MFVCVTYFSSFLGGSRAKFITSMGADVSAVYATVLGWATAGDRLHDARAGVDGGVEGGVEVVDVGGGGAGDSTWSGGGDDGGDGCGGDGVTRGDESGLVGGTVGGCVGGCVGGTVGSVGGSVESDARSFGLDSDRQDASSMVTAGATANAMEGNSRATVGLTRMIPRGTPAPQAIPRVSLVPRADALKLVAALRCISSSTWLQRPEHAQVRKRLPFRCHG